MWHVPPEDESLIDFFWNSLRLDRIGHVKRSQRQSWKRLDEKLVISWQVDDLTTWQHVIAIKVDWMQLEKIGDE